MPADTFTDVLGTVVMGTGNDDNSWGENANEVFDQLGRAIAGLLATNVDGGTLDLSGTTPPAGPTDAMEGILFFDGTLLSDQTVIVPSDAPKQWTVINETEGNFDLFMVAGGGDPIYIPKTGVATHVVCDGDGVLYRVGKRTGEIVSFAGVDPPPGTMLCDGTAISRTGKGRELWDQCGTDWGWGNGNNATTFNLPNLVENSRFLRAGGGDFDVGETGDNDIAAHTHTGHISVSNDYDDETGDQNSDHSHSYGGTTSDESQNHTHTQIPSVSNGSYAGGSSNGPLGNNSQTGANNRGHTHDYGGDTDGASNGHTHNFHVDIDIELDYETNATGGDETRPNFAAVLMCIYL